ncbi:DUF3850 domain-containing protein [Patescibacteria group bacterium]|nr:MAG: DUF3850 domain-containing protein [Patescibacteria group bacterium]
MIHHKKIWPQFFRAILEGRKTFELRLADWRCKPGDTLVLEEWNPKTKKYTGRKLKKKVTYVLKTKEVDFWSKKEVEKYGFQVIAFR